MATICDVSDSDLEKMTSEESFKLSARKFAALLRKKARDKGEAYVSTRNKFVPAVTPPTEAVVCNCKSDCFASGLTEKWKVEAFKKFRSLSYNEQSEALAASIEIYEPKRRTVDKSISRRHCSTRYWISHENGSKVRLCKKAFCDIFRISMKRTDWIVKKIKFGKDLADGRGLYRHQRNVVDIENGTDNFNKKSKRSGKCCKLCKQRNGKDVSLHKFPITKPIRQLWDKICNIDSSNKNQIYLCSKHFISSDFFSRNDPNQKKILRPTAVPSLALDCIQVVRKQKKNENRENTYSQEPSTSFGEEITDAKLPDANYTNIKNEDDTDYQDANQNTYNEDGAYEDTSINQLEFKEMSDIEFACSEAEEVDTANFDIKPFINAQFETDTLIVNSQESSTLTIEENLTDRLQSTGELDENLSNNVCDIKNENDDNFQGTDKHICNETDVYGDIDIEQLEINEISDADLSCTFTEESFLQQRELKATNFKLKPNSECDPSTNVLNFIRNDEELNAFCGIRFELLNNITEAVTLLEGPSEFNSFAVRDRICLTLCKLRLDLSFTCLSVIFQIDPETCCIYFYKTICSMAIMLKDSISFPSKAEILNSMPKCFDKFKKTRIVLQCTEFSVEKPKCLQCRYRLYSHNKNRETLKLLIGVAPSGMITLISKVFGGRALNNAIVQRTDIINKLIPHADAIMVDNDFSIEIECDKKCIEIITPKSVYKKQSSLDADGLTRNIAAAKIHVDKSIQRFKLFKIFNSQIPWNMVPYINDITTVVAAIVNMSSSTVTEKRF